VKLHKKLSGNFIFDSFEKFSAQIAWLEVTTEKTEKNLGLIQIYVDSIRSLDSKFGPLVKVSVGENSKEIFPSNFKNGVTSFKNHLNFTVEDPDEKLIEIKIIHQDSAVEIGEFNYNIADLIVRKGFEQELQTFSPANSLVRSQDCEIILALKLNLLKNPE
jgi:hypothetical protein